MPLRRLPIATPGLAHGKKARALCGDGHVGQEVRVVQVGELRRAESTHGLVVVESAGPEQPREQGQWRSFLLAGPA